MRQLTIIDGYLGKNGIEVSYFADGEEKSLELDKFDTGDLLMSAGIIENYKNHRVTLDGEKMDWEDFIDQITLQDEDYALIVRTYEMRKVCNRVMSAA